LLTSLALVTGASFFQLHAQSLAPASVSDTATAATTPVSNVTPVDSSEGSEVVTLPEFSVTANQSGAYHAKDSTSIRVATSIENLPYSVQVMTEQFFNDFKLLDLDEQAPFIGGMSAGDKDQGGGGGTRLRGFFVPYFRNGFYRRQAPDSNSIARVEIVKGPQSAMFGRVSPGGVVNYVSKKPFTKFQSGLSYTVGSYDYSKMDAFATGPVVANKLFYRVDATYYDFERPTDFWYNRTSNLSSSVTFTPTSDTSLTFEFEHTYRAMNGFQSFTRWIDSSGITQASVFDIPNRTLAQRLIEANPWGANSRVGRSADSYYVQLEHRFSEDLSFRANSGYSTRNYKKHAVSTLSTWDTRSNKWSADRAGAEQTIDDLQYGTQIDLTKSWSGASIKQRSLLTFDMFEDETQQKTWALSGAALNSELAALGLTTTAQQAAWKRPDPFDSSVGYLPIPAFSPTSWSMTDSSTYNLYRFYYGGLFNHTAELLDQRLILTGSTRVDWAEFKRQQPRSTISTLRETTGKDRQLTYSIGANYHIISNLLIGYVSYGTSFDPAPQADQNTGEILGNKTSKGVDAGFKGALFEDKFFYTLSAYHLDQDNEAVSNPANPTGLDTSLPALVAGGSTRGEGVSLDLSGELTSHLSLQGNIAWTYVEITKNAALPSLVGTKPLGGQNPPSRSAGLGATYAFGPGILKGVRAGADYRYSARYLRIAKTANSTDFYLPEVNQVDVFVSYKLPAFHRVKADISLNVTNIFDEKKITVAAYAPTGRQFKLTLGVKF
jgi:outer membrane receptor protein involved in Fe transport